MRSGLASLGVSGFVRSIFAPETVIHVDLLDYEKKLVRVYVLDGWTVETYPLPVGVVNAAQGETPDA